MLVLCLELLRGIEARDGTISKDNLPQFVSGFTSQAPAAAVSEDLYGWQHDVNVKDIVTKIVVEQHSVLDRSKHVLRRHVAVLETLNM